MQEKIQDTLFAKMPKANPKLEILKTHFPQCFDKEGKLLVEKLQETLSPSLLGGGG